MGFKLGDLGTAPPSPGLFGPRDMSFPGSKFGRSVVDNDDDDDKWFSNDGTEWVEVRDILLVFNGDVARGEFIAAVSNPETLRDVLMVSLVFLLMSIGSLG